MTFLEYITDFRKVFHDDLSAYLVSKGLESVTVLDSGVKLRKKKRSVAVYPTSASGSTFSHDEQASSVRMNVEFFCNESATEDGYTEAEEYYSALIGFIEESRLGENHTISDSVLCRMEEGWPANGCILLVNARISTQSDYGWV